MSAESHADQSTTDDQPWGRVLVAPDASDTEFERTENLAYRGRVYCADGFVFIDDPEFHVRPGADDTFEASWDYGDEDTLVFPAWRVRSVEFGACWKGDRDSDASDEERRP